jgi:PMR5 N terminal Domain
MDLMFSPIISAPVSPIKKPKGYHRKEPPAQPEPLPKPQILHRKADYMALALLHFYLFPISPAQTPPVATKNNTLAHSVLTHQVTQSKIEPLKNGMSCGTIKKGQNCTVHGRPDTSYLHWRWKPENLSDTPI